VDGRAAPHERTFCGETGFAALQRLPSFYRLNPACGMGILYSLATVPAALKRTGDGGGRSCLPMLRTPMQVRWRRHRCHCFQRRRQVPLLLNSPFVLHMAFPLFMRHTQSAETANVARRAPLPRRVHYAPASTISSALWRYLSIFACITHRQKKKQETTPAPFLAAAGDCGSGETAWSGRNSYSVYLRLCYHHCCASAAGLLFFRTSIRYAFWNAFCRCLWLRAARLHIARLSTWRLLTRLRCFVVI